MRSFLLLLVAVVGVIGGGLSIAPAAAQDYPIEHFGSDEGLPQVQVHAIAEGAHGYLWVGTHLGGVARFDGHRFTAYDVEDGLAHAHVSDLLADRQGRVWAATHGGVSRLEGMSAEAIVSYDTTDGLPANRVGPLAETPDGSVWVGTSAGLARYTGRGFEAVPALDGRPIRALHADAEGRLWIGTEEGLYRRDARGEVARVVGPGALPAPEVQAVHIDAGGALWIGTSAGAVRREAGVSKTVEATRGLEIIGLAAGARGDLWVATRASGLFRLAQDAPAQSARITKENGLNTHSLLAISADGAGNVWIGSQRGLSRLSAIPFRVYTRRHGLPSELVWHVEGRPAGGLWIGTDEGLVRFRDGRFETVGGADSPLRSTVYGMDRDHAGRLWVGVRSGAVLRETDAGFERVAPLPQGQRRPPVLSIAESADGTMWFGTMQGASWYDGRRIRPDTTLPRVRTMDVHRDRAGRLWFATAEGVRARDARGRPLALPDTLRSFPAMSIAEDDRGHLWFGSGDAPKRVAFYAPPREGRRGTVDWVTAADGLLGAAWFLAFDEAGHLWAGHIDGLSRLDVPRYRRTGEKRFEIYNGAEYTGGETATTAHVDEQGRLWFSANDGLVQYDPAHRPPARAPPRAHVTAVRDLYGDESLRLYADSVEASTGLPARLRLPHHEKHLAFQFTGIDLTNPVGVRYQYRLDGFSSAWSDETERAEASFTNLSPGAYVMQVRARGNDGGWSQPAAYAFTITPPFWQTWWFYLIAAGGVGLLLFGIVRLRERSLKRQKKHLEQQVAERTGELRKEKNRAERISEALAQANLNLEKLSLAVRETDNAVLITDASGRIEWVNQAFTRLRTYTLDDLKEIRGQTLDEVVGRENIEAIIQTAVAEEQSVTYEWSFQTRRGEHKHLFSTLTPVFDEGGALRKLVVVDADISERKRLEEELMEARDRANEAAQAKSAFLANMSHEIRTPMNGVVGMTSLLEDTALDGTQREFVDVIRTSGEALLDIINDILDFSKIEAGKIELEDEAFAVHQVVEEAMDLVRTRAAAKKLNLAYCIEAAVPASLRGDVTRLRQILTNLLSNAVKFTEEGEVNVHVKARPTEAARPAGEGPMGEEPPGAYAVHFAVQDTGIGIPAARRDVLFESFSQADVSTTRKYGGTGLGLTISKRLVELMGGRLEVESKVGEGSTFSFRIDAEAAPLTGGDRQLFETQVPLQGRRVLIVDANRTNRRMLRLQMERWGLTLRLASSGAEALRLAGTYAENGSAFDVAILDMHMPAMDGLEVARRLAAQHPGMARVMLSSAGQRPDAQTAPLDAWLSKPAKAAHLLRTLKGVLVEETDVSPSSDAPVLERDLSERHPLRILLAEDNAVNQRVALRILERLGYRADVVANGQEALDALERQRYDVVLMDVQMSVMNGLDAARRICARGSGGERPALVAVTANVTEEARAACREAGLTEYLSKPFSAADLADVLKNCNPLAEPAPGGDGAPSASNGTANGAASGTEGGRKADFRPAHIRRAVGDDPAFVDELLDTFLRNAPRYLEAMRRACAAANAAAFERAAHTLKSSAQTFGADRLAALCRTLERCGREDRLDDRAAALVAEADDAFADTRAAIAAYRQPA